MGFLDRFIKSSKQKNNFQYLKNLIASDKKEIVLDSDIVLDDDEKSDFIDGIALVAKGMVIDGQGHTIDARGKVRIFNVYGQMITLKNIRFVNGHGGTTFEGSGSTKGDAILAQMDSKVSIVGCEFTDHEGYAIFNLGNMKIEGCRFNDNDVDFLNWNVMEINDLTGSKKGSFQNHGRLSAPDDVKGNILNEGELLDYVPLRDNPYDFDYLNKLICSQKEVMLSHDIRRNFINDEIIIDADDVTIDGCGHLIDGNFSGPIFRTTGKNITLKNLRFINGFYEGEGGAIRNTGEIRLENCEFFQNRSNAGGAIYSYNGKIFANDVNFFDNSSALVSWNEGGGALHVKGGAVELNGCNFMFNESASVGGAISLFNCEMKISDCSFKSNRSKEAGDDIHNLGTLFLSVSRFEQSKTTSESIINEMLLKIMDNHFNNIKIKNTNYLYIYANDSESESKQVTINNEGKIKAYGFDEKKIEFASIQNNESVVFAEHEILPKFLTDQPQWVEIKVFISSTFKDMHAERDYLVTEVFPELKLWCRQRRIILNDIDLRWGVTENDSKSGNTIGVCLKSIDECKPFFLCFLGQRRGWVPDAGKKVDEKTFSRYPQIKDELGKLSITEMEIEHATLLPMVKILSEDSRQHARCSAFFFRQNPFQDIILNDEQKGIYLNSDVENDEKLDELKGMIKNDFRTYEYSCRWDENQVTSQLSGDAQNGRLVDFECGGRPLKDVIISELKSQIEGEFPDNRPIKSTDIYLEDAMLQYLEAKSRISNFAGKDNEIEYLNRFIKSDEKILLIEGEEGIGKSTVLCKWNDMLEKSGVKSVIRLCGATAYSTRSRDLCYSIGSEVNLFKGEEESSKNKSYTFREMIGMLSDAGVSVLILSNLDKIDNSDLLYFSEIPDGFNLIISAERLSISEDHETVVFEGFKTKEERLELIDKYLESCLKNLDDEQKELIVSRDASPSPLFLKIVLNEIKLFGSFAELNDKLMRFGDSIQTAFEEVMRTLEDDVSYPKDFAKSVLLMLAFAKGGLRENDLLKGLVHLDFSKSDVKSNLRMFIRRMDDYIFLRFDRYFFRYGEFAKTVLKRYGGLEVKIRKALIEVYKDDLSYDTSIDLAYHMELIDDYGGLLEVLNDDEMFYRLDPGLYLNGEMAKNYKNDDYIGFSIGERSEYFYVFREIAFLLAKRSNERMKYAFANYPHPHSDWARKFRKEQDFEKFEDYRDTFYSIPLLLSSSEQYALKYVDCERDSSKRTEFWSQYRDAVSRPNSFMNYMSNFGASQLDLSHRVESFADTAIIYRERLERQFE